MPTIKDIAALAGVSHGTVSNVLNKRGNVSVEKINLVENAARTLGFKLNVQAKQLRQGHSRRVVMLVPRMNMKSYCDLFMGMSSVLKEAGFETDIYYSNNLPHDEERLLELIMASNPTAVVVVSSFLKNSGIFQGDIPFIFVDRHVDHMPPKAKYVSFDYIKAGTEIGEACAGAGYRNIAILCGTSRFSNNKQFVHGVSEVLDGYGCGYKVFYADDAMGFQVAFDIISDKNDFDAVITTNQENAGHFMAIHEYNPSHLLPVIYALTSLSIGPSRDIIRYELNYKLCGRRIGKYIIKNENQEEIPEDYLQIPNTGFCYPLRRCLSQEDKQDINILMLSSPTSQALRLLLPSFTLQTGINVRMVEVSYDELHKSALECIETSAYDLIRLDMVWLSELGKDLFVPLNLEAEAFSQIRGELSPGLPGDYYKVDGVVYSLPFDPSVQILYYRKDLFEDALIRREFYERYKRQLRVPKTYREYNEVAAFFTKKQNPSSPTNFGTSLVFGSSVVAACDYLPRLKACGGSIFDESGRVQVDTAEIRASLQEYIEAFAFSDQAINLWWQKSMETFAQGHTAMSVVFANHASTMLHDPASKVVGKIGFAPVPGGCPLLGGGIIGISKHSKKTAESMAFLQWIYSEKVAAMITYLGGYINNKSLGNYIDILELYPWVEGMEKAFGQGWRRENDCVSGSFDEYKFEEILGSAIRNAVSGVMGIEDALKEAQRRCDQIF